MSQKQIKDFIYSLILKFLIQDPTPEMIENIQMYVEILGPIITQMANQMTVPVVVAATSAYFITKGLKQLLIEYLRKNYPDLLKMLQAYNPQLIKKDPIKSAQAWQQLKLKASTGSHLQKKKIIVINQQSSSLRKSQLTQPTPQQQSAGKKPWQPEQFTLIIDQDKPLLQVVTILKKKLNKKSDSIHLSMNSKILNLNTKISQLSPPQQKILRINYVKIQTFG